MDIKILDDKGRDLFDRSPEELEQWFEEEEMVKESLYPEIKTATI